MVLVKAAHDLFRDQQIGQKREEVTDERVKRARSVWKVFSAVQLSEKYFSQQGRYLDIVAHK